MTHEHRLQPAHGQLEEIDESQAWGRAPAEALTPEQARALMDRTRSLSPWMVVVVQAGAGLLVAALVGLIVGDGPAVWSALYGAATVVLPSALLVRGITLLRGLEVRAAAFSFMLWELLKMGVSVAMLVASAWVVPGVRWPVLLVAMLVCMKMNWLALLWQGRKMNRS